MDNADDKFLKIKAQIENDLAQAIDWIDGNRENLIDGEYAILKLTRVKEKLNDLLSAHEEATAEAFNSGCDSEGIC